MLFTVYDPAGEMFEVSAKIAKDLIIKHGWTLRPVTADDLPLFRTPPADGTTKT